MEKRDQDILKKIEEKTKDVQVPEDLMPERIEKRLEEQGIKKEKGNKKIYRYGSLAAAACIVLVAGILLAGGYRSGLSESTEEIEDAVAGSGQEENTDTYEKIYAYLEKQNEESGGGFLDIFRGEVSSGSAADESVQIESSTAKEAATSMAADTGMSGGYSETNVRQEGVDEADIVKTDGRYLYVLKDDFQQISIVDTKNGLEQIGVVEAEKNFRIQEFYLIGNEKKLVYVGTFYEEMETSGSEEQEPRIEDDILDLGYNVLSGRESVRAVTCDITNPEKPKELGSISQSGSYTSSRMAEGYLYLFSNYAVADTILKDNPRTFIPMAGGNLIRESDIDLPPFDTAWMYEVVTAVDISSPSEVSDSKAIFTDGGELYVSNENIYYYETKWGENGSDTTSIRKISYKDGKLSKAVKGKIKGYINDSFSIDEYKGNVRIVATVGDTNSVYVLDEKLKTVGSIKGLAEDERVYSARFLGDVGYFVTYRETDPLFTVDLSDPKKPKIIGKLKIPGFSDYLHFYGENKLLGIGMNVDEDTQITDGVKLSMFDITDKTDVKEENKLVLKNVYSTNVSYDYRAALVEPEKDMIGFAASTEGGEKYFLFGYDEKKGFQCKLSEQINGNYNNAARGVYISDILYVVRGNVIESYSLKDFKKVDDIIL